MVEKIRKEAVLDNLHCTKVQFNIAGCHVEASANMLRCKFQLAIRLVCAKRHPGWNYMYFYSLCSSAISAKEKIWTLLSTPRRQKVSFYVHLISQILILFEKKTKGPDH